MRVVYVYHRQSEIDTIRPSESHFRREACRFPECHRALRNFEHSNSQYIPWNSWRRSRAS